MAADVAKQIDPQQTRKEATAQENSTKKDNDLRLFNYINKYYERYAKSNRY